MTNSRPNSIGFDASIAKSSRGFCRSVVIVTRQVSSVNDEPVALFLIPYVLATRRSSVLGLPRKAREIPELYHAKISFS
jgi:hypothetical protein